MENKKNILETKDNQLQQQSSQQPKPGKNSNDTESLSFDFESIESTWEMARN